MGAAHGFLRCDPVAFTVSLPSLRVRETDVEKGEEHPKPVSYPTTESEIRDPR